MINPTYDSTAMVTEEPCISYHTGLFKRDEGGGADLLWLKPGNGYIDLRTATAHELEHNMPWEYTLVPEDGSLRKKDGFYRAYMHDGGTRYEIVVEILAYDID